MNLQPIFSAIRSVVIFLGGTYFAKKGIDSAAIDSLINAALALAMAAWGIYSAVKNKKEPA